MTNSMSDMQDPPLRPGTRLRSQVCTTEVVVVKAGNGSALVTCGGTPMVDISAQITDGSVADPELSTGSLLGKRYVSLNDPTLELLVSRSGTGTLADGRIPLLLKETAPLPASD
jgi:hypothetical protein